MFSPWGDRSPSEVRHWSFLGKRFACDFRDLRRVDFSEMFSGFLALPLEPRILEVRLLLQPDLLELRQLDLLVLPGSELDLDLDSGWDLVDLQRLAQP